VHHLPRNAYCDLSPPIVDHLHSRLWSSRLPFLEADPFVKVQSGTPIASNTSLMATHSRCVREALPLSLGHDKVVPTSVFSALQSQFTSVSDLRYDFREAPLSGCTPTSNSHTLSPDRPTICSPTAAPLCCSAEAHWIQVLDCTHTVYNRPYRVYDLCEPRDG
jgi:hypothetical protein